MRSSRREGPGDDRVDRAPRRSSPSSWSGCSPSPRRVCRRRIWRGRSPRSWSAPCACPTPALRTRSWWKRTARSWPRGLPPRAPEIVYEGGMASTAGRLPLLPRARLRERARVGCRVGIRHRPARHRVRARRRLPQRPGARRCRLARPGLLRGPARRQPLHPVLALLRGLDQPRATCPGGSGFHEDDWEGCQVQIGPAEPKRAPPPTMATTTAAARELALGRRRSSTVRGGGPPTAASCLGRSHAGHVHEHRRLSMRRSVGGHRRGASLRALRRRVLSDQIHTWQSPAHRACPARRWTPAIAHPGPIETLGPGAPAHALRGRPSLAQARLPDPEDLRGR